MDRYAVSYRIQDDGGESVCLATRDGVAPDGSTVDYVLFDADKG